MREEIISILKNKSTMSMNIDAIAKYYSHDTSPIRRYPDLVNQRIIKSFLHNGIEYTSRKYEDLDEMAIHCSMQEREAEKVEREAVDMKKAEYMESHIGETYTGYISYVGNMVFG